MGGGAAYIWLGGNDLVQEGNWVWNGNNNPQGGVQFWEGDASGSPVGGLYNNWGIEPDNFGIGQDALGLAVTDWPLGIAGQWNDLNHDNDLFFIIEYDTPMGLNDVLRENSIIFPNPADNYMIVKGVRFINEIILFNALGQVVKRVTVNNSSAEIDMADVRSGAYFIKILFTEGCQINQIIQR